MSNTTTTIVVGITGGIAAYKTCEIVRALMRLGYRVKVVMTEAATRFVTPLTFRSLTGEPVAVSLWADGPESQIHHISLAQEADVMLIAPCTANVMAKIARGGADDLLTTTALATEAPLVIAPAMNVHMWRARITRENAAVLADRGVVIVPPGAGKLACGDVGEGRLAEIDTIVDAVVAEATRARDLDGVRLLVTAGGTREPLDPVRYLGNRSSGKTGFAIAVEAARRGADVTLVTGPTHLQGPFGCTTVRITTALEMRDAVLERVDSSDVIVMSAAVADFRPSAVAPSKIKKEGALPLIELERNPDILAELGALAAPPLLIGFAAETEDVERYARFKLSAKHCDLIVANDVSDSTLGFDTDDNRVLLVTAEATETLPVLSKQAIACTLLERIRGMLDDRSPRP